MEKMGSASHATHPPSFQGMAGQSQGASRAESLLTAPVSIGVGLTENTGQGIIQ